MFAPHHNVYSPLYLAWMPLTKQCQYIQTVNEMEFASNAAFDSSLTACPNTLTSDFISVVSSVSFV